MTKYSRSDRSIIFDMTSLEGTHRYCRSGRVQHRVVMSVHYNVIATTASSTSTTPQ